MRRAVLPRPVLPCLPLLLTLALVALDAPVAGAARATSAPPPQRETRTVVTSDCSAVAAGGTGTTTLSSQTRRRAWVLDATGRWVPAPRWSPWRVVTTTTRPATTTECPPPAPASVPVAVSWYVQDPACLAGTPTPAVLYLYGVSHPGLHWWVDGVDVFDGLGSVEVVLPWGRDVVEVTADPGIELVGPTSATYEVSDPCS